MIVGLSYASPSVFQTDGSRAVLGMAADAARPVRFHGRVARDLFRVRVALRALGEVVWSDDTWMAIEEILDPVITVHPDRLFFEAFSQDQSVYANVSLDRDLLEARGEVTTGTTNVDFTSWLWNALGDMRSSRETWLRIDPGGFAVTTAGSGTHVEEKVDVPDDWVRGFLEVQGAMAMPGTRLRVRPVDLLSAIRYLRFTKARISPRALRWEMHPGEDARIVLEPWERAVPLRGATHGYVEPRIIRTWGRRRLRLLEPLLPFADAVDIYLKGRALPTFYCVHMGGIRVMMGLTGWSGRSWSGGAAFELLSGGADAALSRLDEARGWLSGRFTGSPGELASDLGVTQPQASALLQRLCRLGRAFYDVEERRFRHRELFATPIDEARLFPPDPRTEAARAFLAAGTVRVETSTPLETRKVRRLPSPDGPVMREVIFRDWQVTGGAGGEEKVEIVIDERGTILFGRCGCSFFQENILNLGPCEHMLALLTASADQRRDLASSAATEETKESSERRRRKSEEEEEEDEEEEMEEDEEEGLDDVSR